VSEFLAEASVLIAPDTTKFRATLIAELEKATRGLAVPIPVVASGAGARNVVAANKQAAASAAQASTATKELNATRTQQVIRDREAAAAEANLVEAQRLTAAAQARVVAAETAGARSTTTLAAARAQLRAANVAITAGERALAAAELEGADAAQAQAVESLRAAVALRAQAIAAEQAAAGTVVNTRATAASIRRNEQFRRGLEANTLELFKVRGATLAASSGFLAGAAAVAITAKAVEAANAEIEAAARVEQVFGENAVALEHHADDLAESFGLSAEEALKFEGQIGNILKVSKLADDQIPQLSENLVKLAADMAVFNNVPLEQVLKAISLGLVGNSRGLRQFGVELNAASVNAEALRESGKKNTDELTRGERVQARINLLLAQTILQQGAAARRQDSLAQKGRVLRAEIHNLGVEIGKSLIPQLLEIVTDGAKVVGVFTKITKGAKDIASAAESKIPGGKGGGLLGGLVDFGLNLTGIRGISGELKNLRTLAHVGTEEFFILKDALVGAGKSGDTSFKQLHEEAVRAFETKTITAFTKALQGAVFEAEHLATSMARLGVRAAGNQLATVQDQLVGIKIAGGDASEQLANLARQEAIARRQVAAATTANALTGGRSPADLQRLRDARTQLLDIIEQERDIRQQMADDATKAAQEIAQAIADAQQKVQDLIRQADEATIDLLDTLAGKLDIRQLRVEATASLQDDVAFQNELQASLKKRIAIAKATIIDAKLRAQTIHDLTVQLVQSQIAEKQLNAEIAKNRQQRRAAAFDRAAESVDLDIQLAQTEKNKRAEISARERRIRLDQEREKAVRGDIIATKRLRNDIAEQRAAIKELKKELEKRNDALKEAEFLFLTTQAGFAGTLLSNLIPTSAAAGTLGGSVTRPTGQTNLAGLGAANPAGAPVGRGLSAAVQTHTAQKGASMGQMATLIHIQRGMLGVLTRLVSQRTHPEATHQRSTVATSMDTTYGN
jgi:hypothetical protein